jgi:SAM-dependent methyltransferase
MPHGQEAPSSWVARFAHLVKPGGTVLDLACGHGRHSVFFYGKNHAVSSIDRDAAAIKSVADLCPHAKTICADIENGPWPLAGTQFDAIVVTNYLWRPLLPTIAQSLACCGVLIYETFAMGQESVGKPSREAFLLQSGELLAFAREHSLRVVAYEDGFHESKFVQRIVCINQGPVIHQSGAPSRYLLTSAN